MTAKLSWESSSEVSGRPPLVPKSVLSARSQAIILTDIWAAKLHNFAVCILSNRPSRFRFLPVESHANAWLSFHALSFVPHSASSCFRPPGWTLTGSSASCVWSCVRVCAAAPITRWSVEEERQLILTCAYLWVHRLYLCTGACQPPCSIARPPESLFCTSVPQNVKLMRGSYENGYFSRLSRCYFHASRKD